MYSFTNQFGGPSIYRRIAMMDRRHSGIRSWIRYALWIGLIGVMALACRHNDQSSSDTKVKFGGLPATNPTRALVVALEDKGTWYRHLALFRNKFGTKAIQGEPVVVQVVNGRLRVADDALYTSAVFINGKETSVESLSRVAPEFVNELFVMHQWENQPNIDVEAKPYRILAETSSKPLTFGVTRKRFFTLLQAAGISQHPGSESYMFTMNSLLEATFFHNKNALVERTANEHLQVYDEFNNSVAVFINELPATVADVKTIHVREVARLYTKERPYTDWFRAEDPLPRFELHIQTAPKRAKRDSSYYVFSPFYSGDF